MLRRNLLHVRHESSGVLWVWLNPTGPCRKDIRPTSYEPFTEFHSIVLGTPPSNERTSVLPQRAKVAQSQAQDERHPSLAALAVQCSVALCSDALAWEKLMIKLMCKTISACWQSAQCEHLGAKGPTDAMCTMQVARVEAGPDSCTPECSQVDCPAIRAEEPGLSKEWGKKAFLACTRFRHTGRCASAVPACTVQGSQSSEGQGREGGAREVALQSRKPKRSKAAPAQSTCMWTMGRRSMAVHRCSPSGSVLAHSVSL